MSPDRDDSEENVDVNEDKIDLSNNGEVKKISFPERVSRFIADNPWKFLISSLVIATVISSVGILGGEFSVSVDNKGWNSRGTLIADREMQLDVIRRNRRNLFNDEDGSVWEDLETNIQEGWIEEKIEEVDRRRRLNELPLFEGCDTEFYYSEDANVLSRDNVYAVWKTQPDDEITSVSTLDANVIKQICEADVKTLAALEANNACQASCGENKCLPGHSLSLVLHVYLELNELSCDALVEAYTSEVKEKFVAELADCSNEIRDSFDPVTKTWGDTESCPELFRSSLISSDFGLDGNRVNRYSTTYYDTYKTLDAAYEAHDDFGDGDGDLVEGVYGTLWDYFTDIYVDTLLTYDMGLAVGSVFITVIAIGIHTKSMWLTLFAVLQILYSVPLAYFTYYFLGNLKFFPFLNFIGFFVAAALGADDVFVAVDKWKNARLENPEGTTADIASVALTSAASAMLLTTSTTAVAFFATAICPVAPILCFAVFCGLLIAFNYIMNIALIFPALCIYDRWLQNGSTNCLIACCQKRGTDDGIQEVESVDKTKKESLIHRILTFYFHILHKFRYFLCAAIAVTLGVCTWAALGFSLPESSDVRLLPESNQFEKHFIWKNELFSNELFFTSGSGFRVIFGLTPADNGNHNFPDSLTNLVLDETFDPSKEESQLYLQGFCDRLFVNDFAIKPFTSYECPINVFEDWLVEQASNPVEEAYLNYCDNASKLPMDETKFDGCFTGWSQAVNDKSVLSKLGEVTTLEIEAVSVARFDNPYDILDAEWNKIEDWLSNERASAPEGVNKMYHSSPTFWWYDTNGQMLSTAIGAALITIGFSAFIVLLASRSFVLTVFSVSCIIYVLTATTASLNGLGWDLGFLESVCFAILIGISCDFVIHFSHAYIHFKGFVSRYERTKYAVIHMGPSILAAAFTTFSSAIVMLFCKVSFFTKFATILIFTILHATIGSFVVFLTLNVTIGPSEPTKFINSLINRFRGGREEVNN